MITHKVLTKLNNNSINIYLNFSVDEDNVEEASVALMVMHQFHELGLNRLPGLILGWGASTLNNSHNGLNKLKKSFGVGVINF